MEFVMKWEVGQEAFIYQDGELGRGKEASTPVGRWEASGVLMQPGQHWGATLLVTRSAYLARDTRREAERRALI